METRVRRTPGPNAVHLARLQSIAPHTPVRTCLDRVRLDRRLAVKVLNLVALASRITIDAVMLDNIRVLTRS